MYVCVFPAKTPPPPRTSFIRVELPNGSPIELVFEAGRTDGWIDGWTNGQTDRRTGGYVVERNLQARYVSYPACGCSLVDVWLWRLSAWLWLLVWHKSLQVSLTKKYNTRTTRVIARDGPD